MAKMGSMKYNAMGLVSDKMYIEVKVEKMIEFHIRFFIARVLIWLLKKIVHPCKVELKSYEQDRNRSKDKSTSRGTRNSKRH